MDVHVIHLGSKRQFEPNLILMQDFMWNILILYKQRLVEPKRYQEKIAFRKVANRLSSIAPVLKVVWLPVPGYYPKQKTKILMSIFRFFRSKSTRKFIFPNFPIKSQGFNTFLELSLNFSYDIWTQNLAKNRVRSLKYSWKVWQTKKGTY